MTATTTGVQRTLKRRASTNLREDWVIGQCDPQRLDAYFHVAVSAFPYIGKPSKGGWFIPDSGEIAGYGV